MLSWAITLVSKPLLEFRTCYIPGPITKEPGGSAFIILLHSLFSVRFYSSEMESIGSNENADERACTLMRPEPVPGFTPSFVKAKIKNLSRVFVLEGSLIGNNLGSCWCSDRTLADHQSPTQYRA